MKLSSIKLPTTRTPQTTNLPSSRKSDWSTYHLYTMRRSVEEKGKVNSGINEQLKMQRQNSQKLLSRIQTTMLQTQQTTVDFLTRYEQQKIKNQQLQQLVQHYEKEIAEQKLQRHNKTMQNIEINQFEGLKSVLKQREKQLETVTNKLNASQCEKTIKYDIVKAQRRERILFSNQLNGFENEIFDLEYKYKQFLIQRVLLERTFEEKQLEFTKVRAEWEKEIKRFQQSSKLAYQQQIANTRSSQQSFDTHHQNNFVAQTNANALVKQTFYRSRGKMRMERNQNTTRYQWNEINERKIANLQKLKHIKDILNELGFGSFHELKQLFATISKQDSAKGDDENKLIEKPIERSQAKKKSTKKSLQSIQQSSSSKSKLQQLQERNEVYTEKIFKLEDEIYQWSKTIDNLLYKIQHHPNNKLNLIEQQKSKSYNNYIQNISKQHIKSKIQQLVKSFDEEKQSIANFNSSDNLQSLIHFLGIDQQQHDDIHGNDPNAINVELMAQIQEKLTQFMDTFPECKLPIRKNNDRRSLVSWEVPHLQHPQKESSMEYTQKSICPLLGSPKSSKQKKRRTGFSQQIGGPNGLKKLSNLLKNQSRMRGPIDIVSKDQMIKQATQAFDKEGITKMEKFQVKYT